jgi:hypothetical protein
MKSFMLSGSILNTCCLPVITRNSRSKRLRVLRPLFLDPGAERQHRDREILLGPTERHEEVKHRSISTGDFNLISC